MECRTLNLTIVSAKGLKKTSFIGKMDVYAVASISGTIGNTQKLKTSVDKHGDSNPTWNFPMKFVIDEATGQQNRLTLVVKIKAVGLFGGRSIGEVHVPVKELLEGVKPEGKTMQFVSYQIRKPSGKPKGVLSFSYEFGEKFTKLVEPVMAYPPSYGYQQQQQQPGYGYYPPPQAAAPGYGAYAPPPPQVVVPPRRGRMGNSGMGFGTGLLGGALGGMLLGDIMSDHGGGCGGGGCGGGGCGGGCGGGGCGGF